METDDDVIITIIIIIDHLNFTLLLLVVDFSHFHLGIDGFRLHNKLSNDKSVWVYDNDHNLIIITGLISVLYRYKKP